jgi:Ca2+-transporting ATPase
VTDILPAMALIRDPAEPDVMRRPPRTKDEAIVTWAFGGRILGEGALLAAGVLSAYLWVMIQDGPGARANTLAFLALVLVHPIQAMHCRSERVPVWQLPRNGLTWVSLLVLVVAQWCATSWAPLAHLLGTVPLSPFDWLVALAAGIWPVAVLEGRKFLARGVLHHASRA